MIISSPARVVLLALVTGLALAVGAVAQESGNASATETKERKMNEASMPPKSKTGSAAPSQTTNRKSGVANLFIDFAEDQRDLWTSPKELRFEDASWLVPLSGLTAGLFVTDADYSRHISHDPNTLSHYNTFSNAGLAALIGGAGGMWLLSHHTGNSHWRETGFLAGEATVHSLVMTEALKYSLRRERPYQGDGSGAFFQSGGTSFPSEHSAAAWSVASILAHEYPGWLTKLLAYGGASLVSYSRIRAEKHFPSDVVVGALLGELAAHQVYTKHHDVELGGDSWTSPAHLFYEDGQSKPGYVGSPYVPLDSWIYPAIDRLAAMGFIDTAFAGMRPWTRLACAQMIIEAQDRADAAGPVVSELVNELQKEFQPELGGGADRGQTLARLESVYFRGENISGMPLTDGYHFGQTQINDFGRPYGEGWNTISGFSAYTTSGPWSAYVRGEYQTAPLIPVLSARARQYVATSYGALPVPPAVDNPSVNQFRLLDAYLAWNFQNWQLSFGKQSLWWGPSLGGAILLSSNSEPVTMFRIDRATPLRLPWMFGLFGPLRWQFFLGRLSGHEFVRSDAHGLVGEWGRELADQPFILGQKLSFKPSRNFEFGIGYTRIAGGSGQPFTAHQFLRSLFSLGNGAPGSASDPGDIRSGVDFTYRVPGLRNWLAFYGEAFTEDEYTPLAYPRKSAYQGGFYMPRIPGISKIDLRIEGGSTEPADFGTCIGCFYTNTRFLSGYTNNGHLMGSWLGRAGQGVQAWSTYWLSSQNKIEFHYRHQKSVADFVAGGGTVNDAGVAADIWINATTEFSGSVQYERWSFPILADFPQTNVSSSVKIAFFPHFWRK